LDMVNPRSLNSGQLEPQRGGRRVPLDTWSIDIAESPYVTRRLSRFWGRYRRGRKRSQPIDQTDYPDLATTWQSRCRSAADRLLCKRHRYWRHRAGYFDRW